jgi:hypothetical protein
MPNPIMVQIPKITLPKMKQRIPRVPLALLGNVLGGAVMSGKNKRLAEEAFKKPYEGWQEAAEELAKELDVSDVPRFVSKHPMMRNQAFYSTDPLSGRQHSTLKIKPSKDPAKHGVIVMGEDAPLSILGHEMGHAAQQKARGPIGKKVSLLGQNVLAGFSVLGALIAGAAFKGGTKRLAAKLMKKPGVLKRIGKVMSHKAAPYVSMTAGGLGTGYAMNYPKLSEEWGASEKAIKALKKLRGVAASEKARKRLRKAYKTYQIAAAIPTIMGTLPAALPSHI